MSINQKVLDTYGDQIYKRVQTLPENTRWWGTERRARFIRDWDRVTEALRNSTADLSKIILTGGTT